MSIIGIDPGPERSAVVSIDNTGIVSTDFENAELARILSDTKETVAIEDFVPYGHSIGHESLATIRWIGVFGWVTRTCDVTLIPRPDIKAHLCGTRTAKDADVRDALIHRYGPGREKAIGTKKAPGPLYGITSHGWSALAVAVVAMDRLSERKATA